MPDNDDTIIAEIAKNSREVIRVTLGTFNNRPIAGARVWFKAADGRWLPGKSGIAFKVELLPAVADAFAEAVATARASGALE
jgi:hypothetical protein